MTTTPTLTKLEREVAEAIRDGKDPWFGRIGSTGTRTYSQALSRCERKGILKETHRTSSGYELTPLGLDVVGSSGKTPT